MSDPDAGPAPDEIGAEWSAVDDVDLADAKLPLRLRFGHQDVLLFRVGDGFRAVQRTCPHQHASLADATLVGGDRMLRCAMHGYTYRLGDGKGVNCPGYRIKVFDATVRSGRLYLKEAR